jgi:hypothetical protein
MSHQNPNSANVFLPNLRKRTVSKTVVTVSGDLIKGYIGIFLTDHFSIGSIVTQMDNHIRGNF